MAKKKKITREDLDQIERAAKRQEMLAQGVYDGRYRPKVVPSKKKYKRKKKGDDEQ